MKLIIKIQFHRYFIGVPPMKPSQRHLYRVSSIIPETGTSLLPATCITCVIPPPPENHTSSEFDEFHLGISTEGHSLGKDLSDWSDQIDAPEDDEEEQEEEDTAPETPSRRKKSKKSKQGSCKFTQ